MKRIRQGDVFLKRIEKIPANAKEIKDKVLAYGEVTFHKHRFLDEDKIKRYQDGNKFYLEVLEHAKLYHEEHNKWQAWDSGIGQYIPHDGIILPGIYEQEAEREWDYIDEEAKKAVD